MHSGEQGRWNGRSIILGGTALVGGALPERVELRFQALFEVGRCRFVLVAQFVGVRPEIVEFVFTGLVFDVKVVVRSQGLHPGPSPLLARARSARRRPLQLSGSGSPVS